MAAKAESRKRSTGAGPEIVGLAGSGRRRPAQGALAQPIFVVRQASRRRHRDRRRTGGHSLSACSHRRHGYPSFLTETASAGLFTLEMARRRRTSPWPPAQAGCRPLQACFARPQKAQDASSGRCDLLLNSFAPHCALGAGRRPFRRHQSPKAADLPPESPPVRAILLYPMNRRRGVRRSAPKARFTASLTRNQARARGVCHPG